MKKISLSMLLGCLCITTQPAQAIPSEKVTTAAAWAASVTGGLLLALGTHSKFHAWQTTDRATKAAAKKANRVLIPGVLLATTGIGYLQKETVANVLETGATSFCNWLRSL